MILLQVKAANLFCLYSPLWRLKLSRDWRLCIINTLTNWWTQWVKGLNHPGRSDHLTVNRLCTRLILQHVDTSSFLNKNQWTICLALYLWFDASSSPALHTWSIFYYIFYTVCTVDLCYNLINLWCTHLYMFLDNWVMKLKGPSPCGPP